MLRERIITALVLLPIVVWIIITGGLPLLILAIASCYWINYEYFSFSTNLSKFRCVQLSVCSMLLPALYLSQGLGGLPLAVFLFVISVFFFHLAYIEGDVHQFSYERTLPASMLGLCYTGVFGTSLVIVCHQIQPLMILWLLFIVMSADTFAYFGGRAIGGVKLSPRVSPKKTVSGAVCGVSGAVVMSVALGHYLDLALPLTTLGLYGLLIAVFSVVGDLVESLIKRSYDVKDSGTLLPGHGGLLDRLDAVLFCLPILLFM